MTNLKLTDKEVSALIAAMDLTATVIGKTEDEYGNISPKNDELIKQFTNVMNKLDKAV